MQKSVNKINGCEVCGNKKLFTVLNLGLHPMCDDLVSIGEDRVCDEYPIEIVYCSVCCTAHQKYQVPKKDLFPQTYHYRSRFTADVLNGMKGLVERCEDLAGSLVGLKVLDVGCNDGSLLSFFREKGASTIGIEPTGACADAAAAGHITYNMFLTPELAAQVLKEHGHPDLIVFTNVFAHIENLNAVLESLRCMMGQSTMIVIENHYLGAVLDGDQFDTFYHEHPRTYSYTSFVYIAQSLGLCVNGVEFPTRYGGNIRVFLRQRDGVSDGAGPEVKAILSREATYVKQFEVMQKNIEKWRISKRATIEALVSKHGKIAAKAFPGRAAILVKLLALDTSLISVVHEKPGSLKIGHYLPGTRIPIVSDDDLFASIDMSLPIINMAWHISSEIHSYLTRQGYEGPIVDILSREDFA